MRQISSRQGFTLVELLVVISIIVVLMAILFPAFQSAREKARQTRCITNLHAIDIALKAYLQDYRRFPFPPEYNGTRYVGGPAALYPDYIQDHEAMVCPADRKIDGVVSAANASNYCSYAGVTDDPASDKWGFLAVGGAAPASALQRLYNWGGYDAIGFDESTYDTTKNVWVLPQDDPTAGNPLPSFLATQGLGWRSYPRLQNRRAPDNTIVLHCVSHRDFYKTGDEMDTVIRLGGNAATVKLSEMNAEDAKDTATPKHTAWQEQKH
jgi:prepilin-type N-terminal cleavage/methylation domain-containing protein